MTTLRTQALITTNGYRAKHGAPNLEENAKLNQVAQKYAETLLSKGVLEHSSNGFGENLYYSMGYQITGNLPVDAWYSEVNNYNFERYK